MPREALSAPERDDRPAYELTPAFDFARERCYFLVRANNYDARDGTPRWGAAAEARAARRARRRRGRRAARPTARRCGATAGRAPPGLRARRRRIVHRVRDRVGRLRADVDPRRQRRPRAGSHPTSAPRCCTRAARRGSSRPPGRARPRCSPRGSGTSWSSAATAPRACARSRTTGAPAPRCRTGSPTCRGDAQRKVRTLNSLGYEIVRRARPGVRVIDEREIRERIEPHLTLQVPRQHRRARAPTSKRSKRCSSGCARPSSSSMQRGDVEGFAAMYRHVPRRPRARRRHRLRRADRGAIEALLPRARRCGARCSASAATCSSTSSKTSAPRTCCSCGSSPRPPTTCSASATTTR